MSEPTAGEPPSFYRTSTDVDADLDALTAKPDAGEVEALALLISCTEIAQDENGDAGTLMYEPARRLAADLLASDWLDAERRKAAAHALTEASEAAHCDVDQRRLRYRAAREFR